MKSITLFTEEVDDFEDAVDELKEQLENFSLQKNTLGIIFTNAENDVSEMMEIFREAFPFPMIGTTALAMLTDQDGYSDMGIAMLIMTADDVEFHIGMAENLTYENHKEKMREAYEQVKAGMQETEKLIITYGTMIPEMVGDDIVNTFDSLSKGVPVYGALSSDGFTFSKCRIFDNTRVVPCGFVFVLISGNIKPLVSCEYSITNENQFSAVVTRSEGNQILELDKGKFVDVLKEEGLESGNTDCIMEFTGTPFVASLKMKDGNQIRVMRFITTLDQEKRSGTFLGGVPEGSKLGLANINRTDVEKSIHECLDKMLEQLSKEEGYEYSTFLFNSCAGRYLLLARDHAAEARAYQAVLPDNIHAAGFYSFGEIAPIQTVGGNYNVFHNSTFTILAI